MKKYMSRIFVALVLFAVAGVSNAQPAAKKKKSTKKKQESTESVYSYVDSAAVPEKFQNESIVILGHYEKMTVFAPGERFKYPGKTEERTSTHYTAKIFNISRFLLQDRSALEKFSTYYFTQSETSIEKITVIRKTGERIEVDMSKAIEMKDKVVSEYFEFSFGNYKKIALPGLEVGDMVEFSSEQIVLLINMTSPRNKVYGSADFMENYYSNSYYSYSTNSYGSSGNLAGLVISFMVFYPQILATKNPRELRTEGHSIPEFVVHLNKVYPVVKQAYDVETPKQTLPLEYLVLNNGPKPSIKDGDKTQTMHIESEMNDAISEETFFKENSNIPAVRYSFNLRKYAKFNMHVANMNGSDFGDAQAKLLAQKLVKSKWKGNAITKLFDFEKAYGRKLNRMDAEEKLKYFYYYYKKNYSLAAYILSKGDDIAAEGSVYSTKFFQLFCERYDIPYEIVMFSSRTNGATKTALTGDGLRWGILAHPNGKNIYVTDFDAYSEWNVPHQFMYGSEVYYVDPKGYSVRSELFQQDATDGNALVMVTDASVGENAAIINLNSNVKIYGEMKNNNYKLVTSRTDFAKYYKNILGDNEKDDDDKADDYLDLYYYSADFKDPEKQDDEKDRLNQTVDKYFKDNENERHEDYLSGNYAKDVTVSQVDIKSRGLTKLKDEKPTAIDYTVTYQMENIMYDIGQGSKVLELGRLMTTQITLNDLNDRSRKYTFDVDYQKSFDYTVTIAVPEGYRVVNLSDFNKSVDNDLCSFVATATETAGKITFHCVKTYKKVQAPASDWSKVLEVMDAAAMMYQKKLLFEK